MAEEDTDAAEYSMYHVPSTHNKSLLVSMTINYTDLEIEVDTGAALSIISEATYRSLWPSDRAPPL